MSLLKNNHYVKMIKGIISQSHQKYENLNPHLKWELLKCDIRGASIQFASKESKKRNATIRQLECEIANLELMLSANPYDSSINDSLIIKQTELSSLLNIKTKGVIIRSRIRWCLEGERCTKYFLNLEKKNYQERCIRRLQVGDECISSPNMILEEERKFYSDLYSSVDISDESLNTYFNDISDVPQLSHVDKHSCEGALSNNECVVVLSGFKNGKTPGNDGLPPEFYKLFWPDINELVLQVFRYSFQTGELSPSMKEGVINLIPKKDKSPLFLKNWRPISILNTDYKLLAGCLANRLKKVLPKIISNDQSGFLHGRYIGECIRKVIDIISFCENECNSALLFFADFEKAFDSVERKFLFRALESFNFGPDIIKYIKVIYTNIKSTVLNNGFWCKYFNISRGVRQGCPLSPYLFLICAEILAMNIRQSPSLNGIRIRNNDFRICQYADDTVFFIDMSNRSFTNFMHILEQFANLSGLKINYDKCYVKRVGPCRMFDTVFCEHLPLIWTSDTITYLGIKIPHDINDVTCVNFAMKSHDVENCLKPWSARKLSIMGKVTIIRSLVMPKLTYCFSMLPNPSESFFNKVQKILFNFLWDGKPDRIKRDVLLNTYNNGGLQVPHVKTTCNSLKASWVKRFLCNIDSYFFLQNILAEKGGLFFFDCNLHYKDSTLLTINNDFYRNVIQAWFLYKFHEPSCVSDYMEETIWFNSFINIEQKVVFYKRWFNKGIRKISDICNNDGTFMSYQSFCDTFNITVDFLSYFGILHAVPFTWRFAIQQGIDNYCQVINSKKMVFINSKNSAKIFYKDVITQIVLPLDKNKIVDSWKVDCNLDNPTDTLQKAFAVSFKCTLDPTLRNFNFKFLHRIIPTNSYLYKAKLNDSPICNFCNEYEQTLIHMYSTCKVISSFWKEVLSWLKEKRIIDNDLSLSEILVLYVQKKHFLLLNTVFNVCKYFIFCCKCKNNMPSMQAFLNCLRSLYELECQVSLIKNKTSTNYKKWSNLF